MARKFFKRPIINSILTSMLFTAIPSTSAGKPDPVDPAAFQIKSIDDACHQFSSEEYFEWWYMDASFDNGYSFVTSWQMANMKAQGVLTPFRLVEFSIYDPQGKKTAVVPVFKADEYSTSPNSCDVTMGNNHIKGDYPLWNIEFLDGNLGCKLSFGSLTQGFRKPLDGAKYFSQSPERYLGWVIAQPKARVTGKLILDGKEIPVTGVGYHDHNWGNCRMPELYSWWHWGRFLSTDYTIIYAAGKSSAITGETPQSSLIVFKGHDLIEFSEQIYADPGELTLDEVTGVKYQKKLVLRMESPFVKGSITHNVKNLVENNPTPAHKPGQGRGYLRFLSDCDIDLNIKGDQIKTNTMLVHEYMQVAKSK
ncbi:MAG: hypothetical protein JXA01_08100 [Dehalococcoidia bacterium]|nr:hypothetical protein [Dehalococcoidia bacterium]